MSWVRSVLTPKIVFCLAMDSVYYINRAQVLILHYHLLPIPMAAVIQLTTQTSLHTGYNCCSKFSHNNLALSRRRAVQSNVTTGGLDRSTSCHSTPLWCTHESRYRRTLHRIRRVYRCHCSISVLWTDISSCHIETNYKENITIIQTRQSITGSDFVTSIQCDMTDAGRSSLPDNIPVLHTD